ncbi:hypothetical protein Lal_00013042 [Lupinus albus]|nr:hypothetical protein Lal_00013042 [Lupinus albus]
MIEISSESTDKIFKVNGHRLKPFLTNPSFVDEVVEEKPKVADVYRQGMSTLWPRCSFLV